MYFTLFYDGVVSYNYVHIFIYVLIQRKSYYQIPILFNYTQKTGIIMHCALCNSYIVKQLAIAICSV